MEILIKKLENQIEYMLDTLVEIQKKEAKDWPARHLWTWYQTALGMIMFSMLSRHLWDKIIQNKISVEQAKILSTEIWNATHEHYLQLYWYDSKKH